MLIDTHSHIYLEEFDNDRFEAVERAKNAGVEKIILPNVDLQTIEPLVNLANSDLEYFGVADGLHPTSVKDDYKNELETLLSSATFEKLPNVVAIGEIGMDLYWDTTFIKEQKEAFDFQLSFAKEKNLPVIIHCRNAFPEIIDIVSAYKGTGLRGVFHCFSEDYEAAKKVIELDYYIGIGGVLTYKKSTLPDVVAKLPLSKIVLETDSPYLAPVPHRGKRNESAFVSCVAEKLALLHGRDFSDICKITTGNAKLLFSL